MSDYIQVTTTTPSREDADHIRDVLIGRRLAACVQVVDTIDSTYLWQGKVENVTEWLCLIKTERRLYDEVEAAIIDAHPYDVPEVLAFDLAAGSKAYLSWLSGELRKDGSTGNPSEDVP
jgi:periplasmic divalent cation tolerance protein